MSLLHSFYCWNFAFVVLSSTAFFHLFGMGRWRLLACASAVLPTVNLLYFTVVPLGKTGGEGHPWSISRLYKQKLFWFFVLLMICSGAAEQAMSQWVSAFAESGLNISKTWGDLAGPCLFAVLMGVTRTVFGLVGDRVDLRGGMTLCGVLSVGGYLLAAFSGHAALALAGCAICGLTVSIMWPGTISMAAKSPMSGTAMFALLAFAGDIGAITGPALVGVVANMTDGTLQKGLAAVVAFPMMLVILLLTARTPSDTAREQKNY